MKYTFKGNFGLMEFAVDKNGEVSGTYQKKGSLSGTFKNQKFSGYWKNKGLEGLVEFTISDGVLEGKWKKGKEPGPMKSKWSGKQLQDSSSIKIETDNEKSVQNQSVQDVVNEVNDKIIQLKNDINKLYHRGDDGSRDSLFEKAMELVIKEGHCSLSFIQSELKLGANRAKRIIDQLETDKIIIGLEEDKYDVIYNSMDSALKNSNGYLLVIEKFEENKELLESDEKVINQYLWSLYLTDGNVQKCFEMIKHYEQKFKPGRWLKLKGHCYSKFKWYDFALKAYEDSNSSNFLEIIQKVFNDFSDLIENEKWELAIDYFEENLYLSVSENHLNIAVNYCRALYRSSESNEIKALEKLKEYIETHPEHKPFLHLAGSVANFLGKHEEDLELLDEASIFYKKAGNKEGMLEVKESIKKVKLEKKRIASEEKAEKAKRDADAKKLAAERKALEKDLAKQEAALKKLKQCKFKSSKGETFCQFCGRDSSWSDYDCNGRQHGHNYVLMKVDGIFKPICNKCGSNASFSEYSCN